MKEMKELDLQKEMKDLDLQNIKDDCLLKVKSLAEIIKSMARTNDTTNVDFDSLQIVMMMISDEITTIHNIDYPDYKETFYFDRL